VFSDNKGGPPGVGQFMLAIDPAYFGVAAFAASLGRLAEVFGAAKVRLPGSKVGDPANWRETMVDVDAHLWRWSLSLVE
jgi:(2R)-3-sulfolactate dehydrogenase (NADP+)